MTSDEDFAQFQAIHADLVTRLAREDSIKQLARDFATGTIAWDEYLKRLMATSQVQKAIGAGIGVVSSLASAGAATLPGGVLLSPAVGLLVGTALTAAQNHFAAPAA